MSGAVGTVLLGHASAALPWLIAPIGASAVLVFAVPASPLAQPWSVVGGNILSGAIGLMVGHFIGAGLGSPLIGAGLAVGLAIAVMGLSRCLHPPGGACALLYALNAAGTEAWGMMHLMTIAVNVVSLAGAGWIYNNMSGHSWPHRAVPIAKPVLETRSAAAHDALTAVLAEWDELIDADIDDLEAIFQAVERRIRSREQEAPPAARL